MMDFSPKKRGVQYHHQDGLTKDRKLWPKILLLVVAIFVVGLGIFLFWPNKSTEEVANTEQQTSETNVEEAKPKSTNQQQFNAKKLQTALDSWAGSQSGTSAVVIADENGKTLAQTNQHHVFFAASIYKLYVAYEGYKKIDDGTYSLDEPYLGDWDRQKCLYEMIHSSHSPCAEKLWNELGKSTLDEEIKQYGITDTSMVAINTSAHDAGIMLAKIWNGEGLKPASQKAYLNSMLNQIYRDALPKGFSEENVYDKVGFNGDKEYHDVGIIKFKDGRVLIVSVMTENVGTANIIKLAKAIKSAVN